MSNPASLLINEKRFTLFIIVIFICRGLRPLNCGSILPKLMLVFNPLELIQVPLFIEDELGGGPSILQLRFIRGLCRLEQDYGCLIAS